MRKPRLRVAGILGVLLFAGCQSYMVPGGPADLSKLGVTPGTDRSIAKILDKKPLVTFPATLALARVQASDYRSYTFEGSKGEAYSLVAIRDVETDADVATLEKLPKVAAVVMLKRILIDRPLADDEALRVAAARLHANPLLFYTFDTEFHTDTHVAPLGIITLGAFPTEEAKVTCTASAVLMDVHNGYVYDVIESTRKDNQLANAWTSDEAMDQVRRRTERAAFDDLLKQFQAEWPRIVASYDRPEDRR